jgi:hypothetical protein
MTPELDLAEQNAAFRVPAKEGVDFLARNDRSRGQLPAGVQQRGAVVGVGCEAQRSVLVNLAEYLPNIGCGVHPRLRVLPTAPLERVVLHVMFLLSALRFFQGYVFTFFRVTFFSGFTFSGLRFFYVFKNVTFFRRYVFFRVRFFYVFFYV